MVTNSLTSFNGKTLLKGVACGPLFFYEDTDWVARSNKEGLNDAAAEVEKYQRAISITKKELSILLKRFQEFEDQQAAQIFEAHLAILEDPLFSRKIQEEIISAKSSSQAALEKTLSVVILTLEGSNNPFFAERAVDIKDLARRISLHLLGIQPKLPQEFQGAIVCVNEVTPSMAAEGALKGVKGFISVQGSNASHTAVVLKSRSIPHLIVQDIEQLRAFQGQLSLLDTMVAKVVFHPPLDLISEAFKSVAKTAGEVDKKSVVLTKDGVEIQIFSTFDGIEYSHELKNGIGLYRTEFILLHDREVAFCEERQILLYRSIMEEVSPNKVVFRLFDLGGDKNFLQDVDERAEKLRSIQYLIYRSEILDLQIRSLIQASTDGPLHILVPFVTDPKEMQLLRKKIQGARDSLKSKAEVRLGAMIESPLAKDVLEEILAIADFIAIGTNDLTQELISIHRDSPDFCLFQPDLFKTIKQVIIGAKKFGIPVSICGEIVSNSIFTKALLGLGATEFSCSFHEIPDIKGRIASLDLKKATLFAAEVCAVKTAQEIKTLFLSQPD